MLDSFLNDGIYIKLDSNDIVLLQKLDRKLDCIWTTKGKDVLNTRWFKGIIENNPVYIHYGKNGLSYAKLEPDYYISLKDFLEEKDIEIKDNELLEIFK